MWSNLLKVISLSAILCFLVYAIIRADEPILAVTVNNPDYGGFLFMTPGGKCTLADLSGNILFEREVSPNRSLKCYDFKRLNNGDWIYFNQAMGQWEQYKAGGDTLKATYTISGSQTDLHDIIVADDYVWLMGREDYLATVTGTLAITLRGSTIQKQDSSGNVLFDWHSKNHISTDEAAISLQPDRSFPHSNSFYEDADGNLIVSFRNMDSVVKICVTGDDCQVGEIIWRLGGLKSDFAFINDRGISKQHSALMTDKCHGINRCLILFDNGNDFEPAYSRAVEYQLGQKIVTKTWEYTAGGEYLALATGNVNRLANGDTIIGWGRAHFDDPNAPAVTVVDFLGNIKHEAKFVAEGETSYRAHLYPEWRRYLPLVAK